MTTYWQRRRRGRIPLEFFGVHGSSAPGVGGGTADLFDARIAGLSDAFVPPFADSDFVAIADATAGDGYSAYADITFGGSPQGADSGYWGVQTDYFASAHNELWAAFDFKRSATFPYEEGANPGGPIRKLFFPKGLGGNDGRGVFAINRFGRVFWWQDGTVPSVTDNLFFNGDGMEWTFADHPGEWARFKFHWTWDGASAMAFQFWIDGVLQQARSFTDATLDSGIGYVQILGTVNGSTLTGTHREWLDNIAISTTEIA